MSIRYLNAAWTVPGITQGEAFVLMSLADQANDDGICWPSVRTLAARCRCSVSAVRKHTAALEEKGMLRKTERPGRSVVYTVVLDLVQAAKRDVATLSESVPPPDQTPPQSGGPVDNTPPESGGPVDNTPPESGGTPPQSGGTPPESGGTPPESGPRTLLEPSCNHQRSLSARTGSNIGPSNGTARFKKSFPGEESDYDPVLHDPRMRSQLSPSQRKVLEEAERMSVEKFEESRATALANLAKMRGATGLGKALEGAEIKQQSKVPPAPAAVDPQNEDGLAGRR